MRAASTPFSRSSVALLLLVPLLPLVAACGEKKPPKVHEDPPEADRVKMVAEAMEVIRKFGKAVLDRDKEAVKALSNTNYSSGAGWGVSGPFEKDNEGVTKFFAYPAVKRLCAAAMESDPKQVTYHKRGCKIRLVKDGTTFAFNMWRNDAIGFFVRMIGTE